VSPSLNSVSISNFRSVNGTITIPLNAPVVLVHGLNGAGKTSVLSAIELALTGDIVAMQRADANYRAHLIHRGAEQSRILLDVTGLETPSTRPHQNIIRPGGIQGGSLLPGDRGRFFSERCYLAQATLGRLLEIYQNANPREESALTHFVRDLLGLDALDALIDGLRPAADVRNTRRLSPAYADAEGRIQTLAARIEDNRKKLTQALNEAMQRRVAIRAVLAALSPLPEPALGADLPLDVEALLKREDDDRRLIALNGYRRDLASLRQRTMPLATTPAGRDEAAAIVDEQVARAAADTWRATTGGLIEALIGEVRKIFPDLPSIASTDPKTAFQTAATRIEAELQRCVRAVAADDALVAQVETLNQEVEQSRARVALADEQLATITGEAEGLSRALAALIPHIHGDECPVCGRDYHEVAEDPLVHRVSTQVARLTEQAGRLQGLGRTRASAVTEQAKAERERDTAIGKRLNQEVRAALKARVSDLTEAKRRLGEVVAASVDAGAAVISGEAETQRHVAEIRNRDRLTRELRSALGELCTTLEQRELGSSETIQAAIERLETYVVFLEAATNERQRRRRDALGQYRLLQEQEKQIQRVQADLSSDEGLKRHWDERFATAEHQRQTAKAIARAAASARTAIVGRVFNSALNRIWRDLFVRLAPTEPFVPAFHLPQSTTESVTAQLETVHRDGGSGGAPGAMLSAGNLNTAALTLFLALHLSVTPQLPWLVLDDPVQSMDEVHIAQFAALLRTLAKEHHRQLVIAVHERPLFEYLTLELSPAFAGDQLITIELTRSTTGASLAEPTYHKWEPDRAVAVA
jgi:exonuclease SbcC